MKDSDIPAPIYGFTRDGMPLAYIWRMTRQNEFLTFWQEIARAIVLPINNLMNARWSFPCAVVLAVILVVFLFFGDGILGLLGDVSTIEPAQIGPPS